MIRKLVKIVSVNHIFIYIKKNKRIIRKKLLERRGGFSKIAGYNLHAKTNRIILRSNNQLENLISKKREKIYNR